MTISAIRSFRWANLLLALGAVPLAMPASAQENVRDRDPDVADVALTPLSDLNLTRDPIPPILVWARQNPYANDGLATCDALRSHIGDLDAVLGDDVDTQPAGKRDLTPGGVAQSVVGMFIPFRGIIREVSGANNHEYQFRESIVAGMMRRAYLKGLGEARDCPYPSRPMEPEMAARLQAKPPTPEATETTQGGQFVSRPVVQQTN